MSGYVVEPEPDEAEREAIVAALEAAPALESGWAAAALLEGVDAPAREP